MDALTWRNLALLLHIVGVVILSGGSLGGTLLDWVFWRMFKTTPLQAAPLGRVMPRFAMLAQIGSILMLLSGFAVLAAGNWYYWGQFWLNVKLVLFVLLALNGALVAGSAGRKLGQLMPQWLKAIGAIPSGNPAGPLISAGGTNSGIATAPVETATLNKVELEKDLAQIHQRLNIFHITENAMFLGVLVMAVFKFA